MHKHIYIYIMQSLLCTYICFWSFLIFLQLSLIYMYCRLDYVQMSLEMEMSGHMYIRQSHDHNSSYSSSLSTESPESSLFVFPEAMPEIELALRPLIPESEHEEMTRAILAVLSSSSPNQRHQNPIATTVFKKFSSSSQSRNNTGRPGMFQRSILYYRNLNLARIQQRALPSTNQTQLQHMISERRRREKQNGNFQALRSLLPPGSKKDKASVLKSTREYLSLLRDQVGELSQRNQFLEAQLKECSDLGEEEEESFSMERVYVRIRRILETQQGLSAELQVTVRGESTVVDLLIRILEFLKLEVNGLITLVSIEANRRHAVNHLNLTLRIQGTEWDESAFREAVQRVVS